MADHSTQSNIFAIGRCDSDVAADAPLQPSGKPYRWQLREAETPRVVALPPSALGDSLSHAAAFHLHAVQRTAALLVVLSRTNGYEGRSPDLIADEFSCGTVASVLNFDIDTLAHALIDLEGRGLVAREATGQLRLLDIEALDRLCDTA